MAGICSPNPALLGFTRTHGIRCCSGAAADSDNNIKTRNASRTPQVLKLVVSGVTELLRLFSSSSSSSSAIKNERLDRLSCGDRDEISVISGVDDVIKMLQSDYENAYFVTGIFTSAIYAEDCIFEDPTIRFRGTDLYARNLKLLVPFFDRPSILLQSIDKGVNSEMNFVLATWQLRTYLKFPWRPLISIDGSTVYELDEEFKVVRHAESWNISALEAIGQIFSPSSGRPGD